MKRSSLRMLLLLSGLLLAGGCNKGISITEIRGKTAFGPEFQNFGNNTSSVRYTAIHGIEAKLYNDWTASVLYQRRDVDQGSGDNENLVLFEIGYPIWKKPKKDVKSAQELQIEELENELRELDGALADGDANSAPPTALAQVSGTGQIETNKGS